MTLTFDLDLDLVRGMVAIGMIHPWADTHEISRRTDCEELRKLRKPNDDKQKKKQKDKPTNISCKTCFAR